MTKPVRMAVVGVGHFGRYHAEKIARSGRAELVAVADADAERAVAVARDLGVEAVTEAHRLIGAVDAASVVVPTVAHYEVASALLEAGVHVLVEKPIAEDAESARKLVALAERRGAVLQVGHLPRFYGVTEALRRRIDRPLYIETVRIAPFKPRGTDVNVILDLMIHDLDLVLSLTDASILSVDSAGAPVFSPSEDIANARLKLANGCIVNITASRISFRTERRMRIFQPETYITVDFDGQTITTVRKGEGHADDGSPHVEMDQESYTETDALEREIEAFLDAVIAKAPPLVSGAEGLRALEAAIAINESLRAHAAFVHGALGGGPA